MPTPPDVGVTTNPVADLEQVSVTVTSRAGLGRKRPAVTIINGVDMSLGPGRTYGLVGESGSGKSTLGRTLLGLQPGVTGDVRLLGNSLKSAPPTRQLRRRAQMIYQDPLGSFDPRQTVRESMMETLSVHELGASKQERLELIDTALREVDLPADVLDRRPRNLSGGQRQRASIARGLLLSPELIVADEPFAALDVTTQARVLSVFARVRRTRGMTLLLISHDLALIDLVCDDVYVLYLGEVVEHGTAELLQDPRHPYTASLRSAVPLPDPVAQRSRRRILLQGDPPSPAERPAACAFAPRCPLAIDRCHQVKPPLRALADGRTVACHLAEDVPELLATRH